MKRVYLLSVLLSGLFLSANAQRSCASNEVLQQQMAADPVFARKVRETEKSFKNYHRQQQGKPASVIIPVIVHVLYNTPEQNIPDAQIQSQIQVLNEDFGASNPDYNNYNAGYGAVRGDADISFCLVQVIRKQTSKKSFGANDQAKFAKHGGSDAVNPMNALNIWVCELGQRLLGYAQFPGGPANTYGVVCHYQAFGRGNSFNLFSAYNKGRTMTHEVGHCLGLRHIWGDATCGNDFVDDTPLHNTANFGCPGEGHRSTCSGTPLEMTMNYMDYTDDACMYFFTEDQVSRSSFFIDTDPQIQSIVNSSCTQTIQSPITSTGGQGNNSARVSSDFQVYPTVSSGALTLSLNAISGGSQNVFVYDLNGGLVFKQTIAVSEGKQTRTINISQLPNGIYLIRMEEGINARLARIVIQH